MRRVGSAPNVPRRAFTLIELITVMAILAVLTAMVVGAARGIQESGRRQATLNLFQGLKAALQNYAIAYGGKYPYWTTDDGPMRNVNPSTLPPSGLNEWSILFPGTPQVVPSSSWVYYKGAILYAALMSPLRGGPFARGLAGRTVARKEGTDENAPRFTLFADGWGRPILYDYNATTKELTLRSSGSNPEEDDDDIIFYVLQPSDN